jgi:hypothetical protein
MNRARKLRIALAMALAMNVCSYLNPAIGDDALGASLGDYFQSDGAVVIGWQAEDVAQWAAKHSPTANLLDAERNALGCGLDDKDEDERAQIGLIQAVSKELAIHSRQEAAADALDAYYQVVATGRQIEVLRQAVPGIQSLESLAEHAEQLGVPDGDIDKLADRRLDLEDRWFQADFGVQRLRNQLSALISHPATESATAVFQSPLPGAFGIALTPETHIAEALTHRHDLLAIETLCRCTTSRTLPAVRQLLGALVPGIGLPAISSGGGCGLLGMHKKSDDEDLASRRRQCQQMAAARRVQIEAEVRDALLQLREASERLTVANSRLTLKQEVVQRATRAIELEQASPGADQLAELEMLEQKALVVSQELAVARAIVLLNRTKGTTLQSW